MEKVQGEVGIAGGWRGLAIAAMIAVAAGVVLRMRKHVSQYDQRRTIDTGVISESWLAEHRGEREDRSES